jgi:hypothetical protein
MMTDPMNQYDPASQALIMGQMSPHQRVAQAMMNQGGVSGGMQGVGQSLLEAMRMRKMKQPTGPVAQTGLNVSSAPVAPPFNPYAGIMPYPR